MEVALSPRHLREAHDPAELHATLSGRGAVALCYKYSFRIVHRAVVQYLIYRPHVSGRKTREEVGIRVDPVRVEDLAPGAERQIRFLSYLLEMLGLDVLEHIAGDAINDLKISLTINDVDHSGLKLVSLGALVVEGMQVQRESSHYRDGFDLVSQQTSPLYVLLRLALALLPPPRQALSGREQNRRL